MVVGLRNAVSNGESLESAVQSFIAAGYNPDEVHQASSQVNMGVAGKLQQPSVQPTQETQAPPEEPKKKGLFELFKKKPVSEQPAAQPATQLQPAKQLEAPTPTKVLDPEEESKKKKSKLVIILAIIGVVVVLFILAGIFFGQTILNALFG